MSIEAVFPYFSATFSDEFITAWMNSRLYGGMYDAYSTVDDFMSFCMM